MGKIVSRQKHGHTTSWMRGIQSQLRGFGGEVATLHRGLPRSIDIK